MIFGISVFLFRKGYCFSLFLLFSSRFFCVLRDVILCGVGVAMSFAVQSLWRLEGLFSRKLSNEPVSLHSYYTFTSNTSRLLELNRIECLFFCCCEAWQVLVLTVHSPNQLQNLHYDFCSAWSFKGSVKYWH